LKGVILRTTHTEGKREREREKGVSCREKKVEKNQVFIEGIWMGGGTEVLPPRHQRGKRFLCCSLCAKSAGVSNRSVAGGRAGAEWWVVLVVLWKERQECGAANAGRRRWRGVRVKKGWAGKQKRRRARRQRQQKERGES
jgi:hypothetical protein